MMNERERKDRRVYRGSCITMTLGNEGLDIFEKTQKEELERIK
jgi:hypothetical protein